MVVPFWRRLGLQYVAGKLLDHALAVAVMMV